MTNTWILTTDERIANLVEVAAAVGGTTTVIAVAPSAPAVGGVDSVIHIPTAENVPAEAYAGVVAGLLADAKGDVILAANRPAERSFADWNHGRNHILLRQRKWKKLLMVIELL